MKYILSLFFLLSYALTGYSQANKVVFIEEGTGTWCTNCPRGDIYVQELHEKYPGQFVFVSIHMGDPMEYTVYADSMPFSGIPAGWFGRSEIKLMLPHTDLEQDMAARLSIVPPADLSVDASWDASTRNVDIAISATFTENLSGDYRLAAIVVEDGVTGPSPRYDQVNTYSGGSVTMGGYEDLPNPVPASMMVYNNVARYLVGGFNGTPESLPNTLEAGQTYTYNYSYTLPDDYNEDYVKIAAVLIDASTGEVLNAGESTYLPGYDNAAPFFHSSATEEAYVGQEYSYEIIFHDLDYDALSIQAEGLPDGFEITRTGHDYAELHGIPTTTGSYDITLSLSDGSHTIIQEFQLTIGEATEDWVQVGTVGFNDYKASAVDIEIAEDGTAYVIASDAEGNKVYVYTYRDSSWNQLGNEIPEGNVFQSSLTIASDGFPVVFSGSKVHKWNGTVWMPLGGALPGSFVIYPEIISAGDGTLYLVYFNATESITATYKFNGTDWEALGDVSDNYTVWNRFHLDENGNPLLIYGTDGANIAYSAVSRWDGTDWTLLGGDYINPDSMTYYYHDAIATPEGDIYAALVIGTTAQALNIYKLENGSWTLIAENLAGGAANYCNLEYGLDNEIIVAFRDGASSNRVSAMTYDGEQWSYLGIPGFTGTSSSVSLAVDADGNPWVAYADTDKEGKLSIKKYVDLTSATTQPELSTSDLKLYPNPTSGTFTLEYKTGTSYQIYNAHGELLISGDLPVNHNPQLTKSQVINVSQLIGGYYFIKVKSTKGSRVIKFLKFPS